jgi:ABC-type multidrug transport system fused ATPase/permease subunit
MRLLRDLWAASPRRTAVMAVLIVLGAVGQTASSALAGPVLLRHSLPIFALLSVGLLVTVFTGVAVGLVAARLTADWTATLRRDLCRVAFGQDLPTLETTPVGELLDRIDSDVYEVGSRTRNNFVRLAQSVTFGVLSIGTALLVWWPAGVSMAVLSLVLILGLRRRAAAIEPARVAEEEAWSDLAAVMEESIHGQDDVRTTLARPYVLQLFARRAAELLRRGRLVWEMSARIEVIGSAVMRGCVAVVVVVGAFGLAEHWIDGTRLTSVWLLTLAFAGTLEQVSRMVPELQSALGAWSRILLLRASPQEPAGGAMPEDGDLTLRQLTFRYPGADRPPALRDVSLRFVRGRSYAVIGRTGSGKSTLAKVLTRSVEVARGAVFLGGTDLRDLDLEALRRWVAVVPQRTEILAGTVAENIALFDPQLLDAAEQAMTDLGLSSWVAQLPDGMQTRLGDGGHVLSAGQEQLVAFARILVRDPHVVILDEATARLDPVTEAQVHAATDRLLGGRIGIVIAHRLSSVRRCDEVVVLADGVLVEAGPLHDSERFAQLLRTSETGSTQEAEVLVGAGVRAAGASGLSAPERSGAAVTTRTDGLGYGQYGGAQPVDEAKMVPPPPLPPDPPVHTMREILRLTVNDPRFGMGAMAVFLCMLLLGLDGSVLSMLWADVVGGGPVFWPALGILAAVLALIPAAYLTGRLFPEWWVRQMLRISLRLVHGQTGPRRVSMHTPAAVVAQAGDTERVVALADNAFDQLACGFILVTITAVTRTWVPALLFAATMVVSAAVATAFGSVLERSGRRSVAARAAFATALVSSLSAARTVKLSGGTRPVLDHLAALDRVRSDLQRREIAIQVVARSTPAILSGVLPIVAWALFLGGSLSAGATLAAVSALAASRWFAWTTAALVSGLPSARVWTRRTVAMSGVSTYSAAVSGVDMSGGTAPAPSVAPRHRLRELNLSGFTAVHEDGRVGVSDVDLTVRRGELVLVVGPVGSGKSSLLRALAGIVHHTGTLRWNGAPVTEPEVFLRPNQVGYVGQLPRVLSGTVHENIRLGHEVDATGAVSTAQLQHDLASMGGGLGLLIGHKGTRLSGGQLQRLALARALAPRTELLIADDVSSALDVVTELDLWQALRERGVTVVGSTSKRAALAQADEVVVLIDGAVADRGRWIALADRWGHLAG